jgi:hypothetical protein
MEAGHDPLGVVRDPAKNTPWIELPVERHPVWEYNGVEATAGYAFPTRET